MKRVLLVTAVALAAAAIPAQRAHGADTRVLLCFPGGPGSTADAQPVVDRFLTKLAALAGWSAATGAYYNDMATCRAQMKAAPASVVIVPLDIYLASHTAWKLTPVSTLKNEETAARYHVVGKAGTTLDSLKGQAVLTGLKEGARFLSKIGFHGKVDVSTDFKLERTRSALRAAKNVAKGKAVAAILNDNQLKSCQKTPRFKDLVPLVSGPELPGAIVAGVGSAPPKLAAALKTVCTDDAKLCKDMRIKGFVAVDTKQLVTLQGLLAP